MNPTIDDMLRQAQALSLELDALTDDDPSRAKLLRRQERLRANAQKLADAKRHPISVQTEISMLVARLDEIDAMFVKKGYAEKHLTKGFSDPGAYSATINRRLAQDHASEIADIERRLAALGEIEPADDDS